jgi:hypothetical protein
VVEALDCSAVGEGGRRGGSNGQHGAAKLSSVLLQNGGKGSGGSGLRVPTWRRGKTGGLGAGGTRSNGHCGQPDSNGRRQLAVTWNMGIGGERRGWLVGWPARKKAWAEPKGTMTFGIYSNEF